MGTLLALLKSIPALASILDRITTWVDEFRAWQKKKKDDEFNHETEVSIEKVEQAKTKEEKRSAARRLVDLIGRIGS